MTTHTTSKDPVREALAKLYALVQGECPSLLDEDSGGDAQLQLQIEELLSERALAQEPVKCVTRMSALAALNHLSLHNGPSRLAEATAMLAAGVGQEPTADQVALLDPWMRPEAARELLRKVFAASSGQEPATLSIKRSEWKTLSPEAQAKIETITGAEHPDTRRAKAHAAEAIRNKVLLAQPSQDAAIDAASVGQEPDHIQLLEAALASVTDPKGTWAMTRDEAIELARECAADSKEGHGYLQNMDDSWMPHEWVVEAIMSAAEEGSRAEAMLAEVASALDNELRPLHRNNSVRDRINTYLEEAGLRHSRDNG